MLRIAMRSMGMQHALKRNHCRAGSLHMAHYIALHPCICCYVGRATHAPSSMIGITIRKTMRMGTLHRSFTYGQQKHY